MSTEYDVIIVGAGHNGLVCANVLAKKGKKVLVVEAEDEVGGLACTHEFTSGFHVSTAAHLHYGLHPKVNDLCQPEKFGLKYSKQNLLTKVVNSSGEFVSYQSNNHSDSLSGSYITDEQGKQWLEFNQQMQKFSQILYKLADQSPPRIKDRQLNDYKTLFAAGRELNRLSKKDIRQFLRIIGMNVYDLVEESFSSDLLKAGVCFESILGTRLGPRAPNTVFNLLNRHAVIDQCADGLMLPEGGMGQLCIALKNSAQNNGAEIKLNCRVNNILVNKNQVAGIVLGNGESYSANTVVSNADVNQTLLKLVGPQNLDTDIVRRVMHIPMQGSTAKMHLALNGLPASVADNLAEVNARIIYASDPDEIERASNAIKYKSYSDEPVFEVTIPSLNDPTLAPEGMHVMSVLIPYVPYEHKNGWIKQKSKFEDMMLQAIEQLLPGTSSTIEFLQTLTPQDLEKKTNVTGGHWHHGEIGLERFLMLRPMPGYAQYSMPVDGLFLCGADCHPGGDVNGAAGLNAANAVLKGRA